jgi:hypothetical protein
MSMSKMTIVTTGFLTLKLDKNMVYGPTLTAVSVRNVKTWPSLKELPLLRKTLSPAAKPEVTTHSPKRVSRSPN